MRRHPGTLTDNEARDSMTPAATLLLLLICTDLTFILLHLVTVETGWLRGVGVSLEAERGLPETYPPRRRRWRRDAGHERADGVRLSCRDSWWPRALAR